MDSYRRNLRRGLRAVMDVVVTADGKVLEVRPQAGGHAEHFTKREDADKLFDRIENGAPATRPFD